MLKARQDAVQLIRPALLNTETALAAAMAGGGQLMIKITEARTMLGVSAVVGQKPIAHLARFNDYVAKAWDELVEAHKACAETASYELRLPATMFGPEDCKPNATEQSPAIVLRAVS
jgi:hypothetical protein